jgi:hypothetical protein
MLRGNPSLLPATTNRVPSSKTLESYERHHDAVTMLEMFSRWKQDILNLLDRLRDEIEREQSPPLEKRSSEHDPLEQIQEKLNSLVKPEEAQRWLYAPNDMFEGRRPIDLLEQGEDERVMQLLGRIEEGIHN